MSYEEKEPKAGEKVGVYICHCGGNISDHVDVAKVAENMADIPGVAVTHTDMFMCSDPGQEKIMADIRSGAVDRIVVASCAPALHETTFRGAISRAGLNPYLYEHANIREQVSWVHHGDAATEKAGALISAAVAKARRLDELSPIRVDAHNHATVIGGGVAGMRAALDLARREISVALVEKSPFLGGQTARLDRLMPTGEKAAEVITELAAELEEIPHVEIHTSTELAGSEGYVGNFRVSLRRRPPEATADIAALSRPDKVKGPGGEYVPFAGVAPTPPPAETSEWAINTGAIVLATGFQTYTPRTGEYGYGEGPEVITLPDLIREMAGRTQAGRQLTVNGRVVRRAALIHCVGSRQIPGIDEPDADGNFNEYCSRVCCGATLQAANEIRDRFPDTDVFELYRDIRTYGRGQEEVYDAASRKGVLFFRFEPEAPPVVTRRAGTDYPLSVRVKDVLTFGEEVEMGVDLVVLSVGMKPSDISGLVEMMKLPVGPDRFLLEVHPKLRPVELANTGILLAGTCQAPMDVGEACAAAQAASAKAMTILSRGYVELDPFVAQVRTDRCAGGGHCIEACPVEGALDWAEGDGPKQAAVNPALCTGCGICVAVCPENAIDVSGWALEQYEAMVDAIVAA